MKLSINSISDKNSNSSGNGIIFLYFLGGFVCFGGLILILINN